MNDTIYVRQEEYDQLQALGNPIPAYVQVFPVKPPESETDVAVLQPTDFILGCGHVVYWYGFADADETKRFSPPATLWCSECRRRVRTS